MRRRGCNLRVIHPGADLGQGVDHAAIRWQWSSRRIARSCVGRHRDVCIGHQPNLRRRQFNGGLTND